MYRLVLFCFILFVCFMGGGGGRGGGGGAEDFSCVAVRFC